MFMPKIDLSEQPAPVSQGPSCQALVPASVHGLPATIPGSGTVTSNLIVGDGYQKIAAGLKSSQAGSLSILRFLDEAGTVPQTAFTPTTLSANTAAQNNVNDGLPFASFQVQITNSSGTPANLTNLAILLQSQ